MKGCRKWSDGSASDLLQHDSVRHMAAVSKGARKIMTEMPDQLTSVFAWTVFAGACTLVLLTATCLVLMYESCDGDAAEPVARREPYCPSLEPPRRPRRHAPSGLMALRDVVGADDVHVVMAPRDAHVPWSHACSLESALRAAGNDSRVNVFVVHGAGERRHDGGGGDGSNGPSPVLLSSSLADLTEAYTGRLNVVHVDLAECLEHTPLRDTSPEPAALAVQLAVLWQFGGTAVDAGAVAVRGELLCRASDAAVAYGDRTVSSPVACHAFVYDMMLRARDLWWSAATRGRREPTAGAGGGTLADSTVAWTGRAAGRYARRVADGLEWCPADRAAPDLAAVAVLNVCPVVGGREQPVSEKRSS